MIQVPSHADILLVSKSRGADSCAPGLWRGLVGAWPLQEPGGLTAFDVSGYHNDGTLTNMDAATDHVVTPMGRALALSSAAAAEKVVAILAPAVDDPLTLCGWVKAVTYGSGFSGCPFSLQSTTARYRSIAVGTVANDLTLHERGTEGLLSTSSSSNPLSVNNSWYHVAGVWISDTERYGFVNGVMV